MNERVIGWMSDWLNEWMGAWMDQWMKEWMNGNLIKMNNYINFFQEGYHWILFCTI